MLEKLGLPPKPSVRGNSWVVDASHCQGCSSQFTFINRKHHCRRCGGIFCSSCTLQRMVLRGQGDSPVRICEPCKKLEEAARFELRYGRKTRDAKGSSTYSSNKDDEILKDILGDGNKMSSTEKNSASCSNTTPVEGEDIVQNELGSKPEDLRQQAIVEKQKYKTLKSEGQSEEALRAFKRGKELERQAGALELSLRKNRRRALSSSYLNDSEQTKDDFRAPTDKNNKLPTKKSKQMDELFTELKDLGWSDQDLRDAEKKSITLSVEGELSSLLKEVSQKPNKEKPTVSSDKSQVIVHKKRALELKRAGNLVEAKEELKRAKILERKIEEEELLGEDEDSDDELSSLIRSMDGEEHDCNLFGRHKSDINLDFSHFSGIGDDLAFDGNFEVTDDDMYDPEINSALESLGWVEDKTDRELILTEIQSLKREALNQKRSGNSTEAMALLKKAKLLEKEVVDSDTHKNQEPFFPAGPSVNTGLNMAPKSKLTIQKELLALKKKALTLRREGKLEESEEELKKAKIFEEQLEDMNKAPPVVQPSTGNEDEEDVTDQDLRDPAYLSLLKNLGWEDEDNVEGASMSSKENNKSSNCTSDSAITQSVVNMEVGMPRKSKSEIQRVLLTLKRKALTLRRQGEAEEADEVLKTAKLLEDKLHEFEVPTKTEESLENNINNAPQNTKSSSVLQVDPHNSRIEDLETQAEDKVSISQEKPDKIVHVKKKPDLNSVQQEIFSYKKKAIAFKREGKLAEAKEALKQAKFLEKKSTEDDDRPQTKTTYSIDLSADKEASPSSVSKPLLSSRDKFRLQQQSLGHKRQALKLRREGRTAEADAEFELAKALESRLQELESSTSSGTAELGADDVMVEDFLDPQLLSMLQSIGLDGAHASRSQDSERREPLVKLNVDDADVEREQLVERIKAEKVKAVNLKRSGKQAEALDALRRAKLYEKKLQVLTSQVMHS